MFWYRGEYGTTPKKALVCIFRSMKLLFGSEDWVQKAERWCTSTCQLNPYWAMSMEVMWLCIQCERWYHFECCTTKPRVGVGFATLYDYLSLPLLKGG